MVDTSIINTKSLEDLTSNANPSGGSNLIAPTNDEVWAIAQLIVAGKSNKDIKSSWYRDDNGSKLSVSYSQIDEIRKAIKKRKQELEEQ